MSDSKSEPAAQSFQFAAPVQAFSSPAIDPNSPEAQHRERKGRPVRIFDETTGDLYEGRSEQVSIRTIVDYQKAQGELKDLQTRLDALLQESPLGEKGFTKAGIRKLIARLNEELGIFERSEEARSSPT